MKKFKDFYTFLSLFLGYNETLTLCLLDSTLKLPVKIIHVCWRDYRTLFSNLSKLNKKGYDVHWCVNRTDGKGKKNGNIIKVRSLFADSDGTGLHYLHKLNLTPTCKVETSLGRFHVYFKTETKLSEFKAKQKQIAKILGTDQAVCDLSRSMRLPGFINNKRNFIVTLIG